MNEIVLNSDGRMKRCGEMTHKAQRDPMGVGTVTDLWNQSKRGRKTSLSMGSRSRGRTDLHVVCHLFIDGVANGIAQNTCVRNILGEYSLPGSIPGPVTFLEREI